MIFTRSDFRGRQTFSELDQSRDPRSWSWFVLYDAESLSEFIRLTLIGQRNTFYIEYLDGSVIKVVPQEEPQCVIVKSERPGYSFDVQYNGEILESYPTESKARFYYYCK
jgi:hypothetical protein